MVGEERASYLGCGQTPLTRAEAATTRRSLQTRTHRIVAVDDTPRIRCRTYAGCDWILGLETSVHQATETVHEETLRCASMACARTRPRAAARPNH